TSPSICLSAFPEYRSDYENSQAEADFELALSIAKAGRSLASDYNVLSKSTFYISNASEASHALVSAQTGGIVTLIKGCQSVTSLAPEETVPAGCAVVSLNDEVAMHLLVRGQVNIDQEIGKIEKKVAKATGLKDGLVAKTMLPNYESNVPEEVRETTASKISDYEAEISILQKAIETFLTLKGSN
ncbi:valine--tRNA ligase, partial [Coemansia sp. RSA 2424]